MPKSANSDARALPVTLIEQSWVRAHAMARAFVRRPRDMPIVAMAQLQETCATLSMMSTSSLGDAGFLTTAQAPSF